MGGISNGEVESDVGDTASKLDALIQIAALWAAAHVQHDLAAANGLKLHIKLLQQAVASLVKAVQQ